MFQSFPVNSESHPRRRLMCVVSWEAAATSHVAPEPAERSEREHQHKAIARAPRQTHTGLPRPHCLLFCPS